jgi:aminopeptidase N
MNTQVEPATQLVRLADYRAPAWRVDTVALDFDLGIDQTELAARMVLRCTDASAPLQLDGEELELLSIALDGQALPTSA